MNARQFVIIVSHDFDIQSATRRLPQRDDFLEDRIQIEIEQVRGRHQADDGADEDRQCQSRRQDGDVHVDLAGSRKAVEAGLGRVAALARRFDCLQHRSTRKHAPRAVVQPLKATNPAEGIQRRAQVGVARDE